MYSIRSVLIFLTFLVLTKPVFSQEQDPETARAYYEQAELVMSATKALDDALELFTTAANLDTTFMKANYEAGHMHLLTVNKNAAVKYFLRVYRQDPDYRFPIEYWVGKSYQFGLDFYKAMEYYDRYKKKLAAKSTYQGRDKIDAATVDRAIEECKNGIAFVSNPGNYSIINIGREINSAYDDYVPVLNENEDEIVFTSRRKDDNLNENVYDDNLPYEDIFIARKKAGQWEYAKNIGAPVNSMYHNSNSALSADGNTLFIYSDEGNGDIYYTELVNGKWTAPAPLPGLVNTSFQEKSITMSRDEKTIYFSSDRPGGYGGLDLYKATLDNRGQWTNVRNLGPRINTPFDDDGPFIDYDGVTLYFSSKGHKGMGGYDVFKSTYNPQANEWSEPENLGYPINTPDNDIYIVFSKDGKRAYYSSVREDGMGYLDIYMITIPEGIKKTETVVAKNPEPTEVPEIQETKALVPLKYIVSVIDAGERTPLDARVGLVGAQDNIIVASTSKGSGIYEFTITSNSAKEYRLSVERDGYAFQNLTLNLNGASEQEKTVNRTVEMRRLTPGVVSVLRNIYFDFDKATFKTESYTELNKLEAMMRQNQNIKVEISGHTDAVGTKNYNLFLSRKRAEAVKDYLTKKGIDSRRVTAVGYGKGRPLASNDDERDGRALNRRVEFKVLSN